MMRFEGKVIRGRSLRVLEHAGAFVLTIKGKRWRFDIRDELRIKRRSDGQPDIRHAEKFAFWRKVFSMKQHEFKKLQNEHDERCDWVMVQMPKMLEEKGHSRDVGQVRANVRLDEQVLKMRDRLTLLDYELDLARMMCEAFEHRKSVLMKVRARSSFQNGG